MPMKCSICSHPKRPEIDQALALGQASIRAIARQFGATKDSLARHRAHIPAGLLKAKEAAEVAEADSLLERVKSLCSRCENLLSQAETILGGALQLGDAETGMGAIRTAVAAARELRGQFELLGALTGELAKLQQPLPPVILVVPPAVPPGQAPIALPARPAPPAEAIDVPAAPAP